MARNNNTRRKQETFWGQTKEIMVILSIIFLVRTFGFGLYQVPTGSMETTMLCGERFFADKFTPLFKNFKHNDIISMNEPTYKYSKNWMKKLWQKYVWGPSNWTKRIIGTPGDTIRGTLEDGKTIIYRNGKKLEETYVNQYPLIGIWNMNPLKAYENFRKDLGVAAQLENEDLLQKVASQSFDRYCSMRSYDPAVPYNKQPFYSMSEKAICKGFGQLGKNEPILIYPNDAIPAQPSKLIRKGNSYWSSSDEFYVELGDNEFWVMGDNRRNSYDSRFFGPVKKENIHGKVIFRILSIMPPAFQSSYDSNGSIITQAWNWISTSLFGDLILHPISFWQRIRWKRCMRTIH